MINITLGQMIGAILAICGGITCVASAIAVIGNWTKQLRSPELKQDQRISALEQRVNSIDDFLAKDHVRIKSVEDGNRVTQQAILALLAHGIDGNAINEMKSAKHDLETYLLDK